MNIAVEATIPDEALGGYPNTPHTRTQAVDSCFCDDPATRNSKSNHTFSMERREKASSVPPVSRITLKFQNADPFLNILSVDSASWRMLWCLRVCTFKFPMKQIEEPVALFCLESNIGISPPALLPTHLPHAQSKQICSGVFPVTIATPLVQPITSAPTPQPK